MIIVAYYTNTIDYVAMITLEYHYGNVPEVDVKYLKYTYTHRLVKLLFLVHMYFKEVALLNLRICPKKEAGAPFS